VPKPNPDELVPSNPSGIDTAPFLVDIDEEFPDVSPAFPGDPWHQNDVIVSNRQSGRERKWWFSLKGQLLDVPNAHAWYVEDHPKAFGLTRSEAQEWWENPRITREIETNWARLMEEDGALVATVQDPNKWFLPLKETLKKIGIKSGPLQIRQGFAPGLITDVKNVLRAKSYRELQSTGHTARRAHRGWTLNNFRSFRDEFPTPTSPDTNRDPLDPEDKPPRGATTAGFQRRPTMRKRLTAATLDHFDRQAVSEQAVDLAARVLGAGATDNEVIAAGKLFITRLQPYGVKNLHRMASRIAADTGDVFPVDENEGPDQPESRNTADYVAQHDLTPDHAVMDVVLNERTPTQNPTARRKRAKAQQQKLSRSRRRAKEEEDEDEDVTAEVNYAAADDDLDTDNDDDVDEDDLDPDLENPDDLEMDLDDHVDTDDDTDLDTDDDTDLDTDNTPDMDLSDVDDVDGDDNVDIDDLGMDDDDVDLDMDGDEGPGDNEEFTMDDMEELENLGVDGVLVSSNRKPTKYRPDRKSTKKKAGRKSTQQEGSFRPSRTRLAGRGDSGSAEFDAVFGVPDVGREFED
jgi:hypothetical protein